ncbi:hypothetical protein H8S90_10410 [Olivibacter sp. SDN3]|uniref:tetratricopeptide repeat protein n=1 Tax=Olivibacter sp. SDN3 TaxID=2764720 RepID=UPI0016519F3B|nr:hypothetical protein [Olivibacter sp. SDN3]QNL51946.1 hypothetical protein H8S90_10410 [Olivibacter sp. SDN3]
MEQKLAILCLSLSLLACLSDRTTTLDEQENNCNLAEELYAHHGRQGSYLSQKLLDSSINLCPSYADAHHEISVPYLKRGDYSSWLKYLGRAVELEPEQYLGIQAWCKVKFLHDYRGALDDFLRLDSLNPVRKRIIADNDMYSWMALCAAGLGDMTGALAYIDSSINTAIRDNGEEWVGMFDFFYRGNIKMALEDYIGAISDFDKQLKLSSNLIDAYYYKGTAYLKLGKSKEAKESFNQAKLLHAADGYHIEDPYVEMPWRVYTEEIESVLDF